MLLFDNLFDRFVARLKRTRSERPDESSLDPNQTHTRSQRSSNRNRPGHGMFHGAKNLVMTQPTFIESHSQTFAGGKPVLDLIAPHTDPGAAVDSSARFPPPLCHPGTRLKIGERLLNWLTNPKRQWNMIWLNGPAATGKSAVAQTFAERCVKDGRLGAAFFFSRPNERNDPNTVIPTLIYQLAVRLPAYKSLVTTQLANDPQLMWKARHVQFNQLIVTPFLQLQSQEQTHIAEPLLIILDGLDECKGEDAQRDIIDMISEASRLKEGLPLLWLIVSRPEAHLKHIFSQPDYTVNCGHEELAIDAESIADVDLYIQDGLAGIKDHFPDTTPESWPPQEQVTELLEKASGHFGFASTALRYIGDETYAAPVAQLDDLLSFLKGITTGLLNPLGALDALYAGILGDVPDKFLQITKQILGYDIFISSDSVQFACNFWHINQATFYSAFRKLHSVLDIPTPKTAFEAPLRFYHASFQDYLSDPHRSDGFIIEDDIYLDYAKLCFSWLKTDAELFHIAHSPMEPIRSHKHGALPGLKWVSDGNRVEISSIVAEDVWHSCWRAASFAKWDEDLLSQIHNVDFRYTQSYPSRVPSRFWYYEFVNKLWEADSTSGIIRTEPQSEIDSRLLEYMKSRIEPGVRLEPATFPLQDKEPKVWYYFLVGHGLKAIACWYTHRKNNNPRMMACGSASSKEGIDDYKEWSIGGDDNDGDNEHDKKEMGNSS